jgi:hypothetical protein
VAERGARRLNELSGQPLALVQPHMMRAEYEIRHGDAVAGTLRFRNSWGTLATAECDGGCWTFKRVGFLQTRVTVRPCDAETEIASFLPNTWMNGGTLRLADGTEYRASTNLWQTRYEFLDAAGSPLISYRMNQVLRLSGEMEIHPGAARRPELPWLAMLGWYLAVMMYRDSAFSGS